MNQLAPLSSPLPPLQSAIVRDFGSVRDFRSVFRHACRRAPNGRMLWLLVTARGTLSLVSAPHGELPRGTPLFRMDLWTDAASADHADDVWMRRWRCIDWNDAKRRYESYLRCVPGYPTP